MTKKRILTTLFLLLFAGCNSGPQPEEIAQTFYQLAEIARQEGFAVVQREMYSLLSADSQKQFDDCLQKLGEDPDGSAARPASCFVFDSYQGARGDFTASRTASGPERVRLNIVSNDTQALLELVQEDGWKIDLLSTVELNQSPAEK
jgi:hypothetical protein